MEVILLERVEKLGQMGDVVEVKPGYARNFLLPRHKALRATKENLAYFEAQRAQLEARNLEQKKEAEQVSQKVDGLTVVVIRQAGESGQLYGSVSAKDIAEAVSEAGASIDHRQVILDRPIKVLGLHDLRLRLHPEVEVEVTINVARSEGEAEQQAAAGETVSAEEQVEVEEAAIEEVLAEVEAAEEEEAAAEAEAEEAEATEEAADAEETGETEETGEEEKKG